MGTSISFTRNTTVGAKTVPVRQYRRFRFGEWEDVCHHRRSPPR